MIAVKPYVLVYDVGTSSIKAAVYGPEGEVLTKKSQFYAYDTPEESWAEIDPQCWWSALVSVTGELGASGAAELHSVEAVAVTGQMHTAVLLDEHDEVIAPSILWFDRRAGAETRELQETFNVPPYVLNSSYTLPKLCWMAKHAPEVMRKVKTILWPKDYIRYLMTDKKATDYTEGIGSALIDWEAGTWIPQRIEACGLSMDVLPPLRSQEETYPITAEAANQLGLADRCKVLTGCGDIAALLGGAPHKPGRLVYSLGSSSMYFTETDSDIREKDGLYTLSFGGHKLFGGVSSTTGAALNWAYEMLWGGESTIPFRDAVEKSLTARTAADSVVFLPFLAGERSPFWSDSMTGCFDGLKLHHDKRHLTKSIMEGVACSIRYILDLMEGAQTPIDEIALSGGGAKTPGWPEIIASVTGKRVLVYAAEETVTAVLYALTASVLQGRPFKEILHGLFREPTECLPDTHMVEIYDVLYARYRGLVSGKTEVMQN